LVYIKLIINRFNKHKKTAPKEAVPK